MSFSASASRARDPERSVGQRVMALNHCLDAFDLFGFHATRRRLRAAVGARSQRWTAEQVVAGVALLEAARSSWLEAVRAEAERRHAAKREGRRAGALTHHEVHSRWLEGFLVGDTARAWQVEGLGDCPACGHLFIHHDSRGCRPCRRAGPVELWCREVMPAPSWTSPEP